MTDINPLTSSILQTPLVQKQQTSEKARQLRLAQEMKRNVAAGQDDDESEHKVESSEELTPVDDDHSNPQSRRDKSKPRKHGDDGEDNDEESHIDMTA
jgi:hypothetical protein